jgi:Restriction endonuclease
LKFLVLAEVKNKSRAIEATHIEGFITKAKDHGADKMVFVSAAGFQRGAMDAARRHRVDIYQIEFVKDEFNYHQPTSYLMMGNLEGSNQPIEFSIGESILVPQIFGVSLIYSDGNKYKLPEESTKMMYYLRKSRFEGGATLEETISQNNFFEQREGVLFQHELELIGKTVFGKSKVGQKLFAPDDWYYPNGVVTKIALSMKLARLPTFSSNFNVEPTSFSNPVRYRDVLNDTFFDFDQQLLPLGFSEVKQGNFYFQMYPLRYFYCHSVSDAEVIWFAVESFQHGDLLRWKYVQKQPCGKYYIPVSSQKDIDRLKFRLERYKAAMQE